MSAAKELLTESKIFVTVHARMRHNSTGIIMKAGSTYRVSVDDSEKWRDGKISCNANGWSTDGVRPPMHWIIKKTERWRLVSDADWFMLAGTYARHRDQVFAIGSHSEFIAIHDDELLLYANDLPWMFWNNRGNLRVSIEHLTS